jgi:hypothetical protein
VREQGLALVLRGDEGGVGVALVEHGLSVKGWLGDDMQSSEDLYFDA